MKRIDIQITKAEIKGFTVELGEDGTPAVVATINCYTENNKKVTSFTVSTESYYQGPTFEIPLGMIDPIIKIAQKLESIVVQECNKELMLLPRAEG